MSRRILVREPESEAERLALSAQDNMQLAQALNEIFLEELAEAPRSHSEAVRVANFIASNLSRAQDDMTKLIALLQKT